jgi:protein-disulfide isomerase
MKSFVAAALFLSTVFAQAQRPDPKALNDGYAFTNLALLKPPAGAKVAIYEFEDLECGGCAYAYPIVRAAAASHKVSLERRDYPWSFHVWSFDAAITARYIQDKITPQLADEFRRDVFASQARIVNKDDLLRYTRAWFQAHNQKLPFVMDTNGACKVEVETDRALGNRLNIHSTPCIVVVTKTSQIPVALANISQLNHTIDVALAETSAPAPAPRRAKPIRP